MRSITKIAIYAFACLLSGASYSQTIVVPGTPTAITGGDEIRGRDGTSCKQGTHQRPTLDFGVTTGINQGMNGSVMPYQNSQSQSVDMLNQQSNNAANNFGIYARVVIPLGSEPERLDCTQLYAMELERLKMELERLKKSGSAAVTVQ